MDALKSLSENSNSSDISVLESIDCLLFVGDMILSVNDFSKSGHFHIMT